MSQTIDDRIVQLEFDNGQFEKEVGKSLATLQKLKDSLDLDSAAKNLNAISDASKKVDFTALGTSIDNLSEKFSTMRMVGLMALSNIVDGAFNVAKKIGSVLTAPIQQMKSGGWARALNLEQAKFMLDGMADMGIDTAAVMRDVDEAVTGTAYSLDEAAKVAASFGASGLKAGTEMLNALKGVAGTAAMTNSSFSDIGQIFTTVAGQGKVMTRQLRQLEARGMNAAATLAKHFDLTEEEIRDMVQHGEISFQMFSEAMTEAFGEHAQDANNTFNGALSNMKSALNRIGAEFAQPILRDAIPVFNSLRLMINAIKGSMGDVIYIFDALTKCFSKKLVTGIDKITEFIKSDSFKFNGLRDLNEALMRTVTSIMKIGQAIGTAFKTVFNGSLGDHINRVAKGLNEFSKVLAPSNFALNGLTAILTIIFRIVKTVGTLIGKVVKLIGGSLIKVIARLINFLFSLIGCISNIVSAIGNFVRSSGILERVMYGVSEIIFTIQDAFEQFKHDLTDTSTTVGKVAAAISKGFKMIGTAILTVLALPVYAIYTAFEKIRSLNFSRVITAFNNLKNLIVEGFEYIRQLPIVQGIIDGITTAFFGLVGVIMYVADAISELFNKLADGEITIDKIKAKILSIPDTLKALAKKIKEFFSGGSIFANAIKSLGGVASFLAGVAKDIKASLKDLTPSKMLLLAFAMSMLVLSLMLNKLGFTLNRVLQSITFSLGSLRLTLNGKNGVKLWLDQFKTMVLAVVQSLVALAAAFYIFQNIKDLKGIAIIIGSFIAALTTLAIVVAIVDKLTKSEKSFRSFTIGMAILSSGVLMLANALNILSQTPMEGIWKKVGVLGLVMLGLIAVSFIISKFTPSFISSAISILAFAIALNAACKALKKLDEVDLSKLKGTWPEIAAVLVGIAMIAGKLSSAASMVAGSLAFLAILVIFIIKLRNYGQELANNAKESAITLDKFKKSIDKVVDTISEVMDYIWEKLKSLGGLKSFILIGSIVAAMVLSILGLRKIFSALGKGMLSISKEGKYIRRAAMSIVMIAASVAGLMYVSKLLGEWMRDNPKTELALKYIAGFVGGIMIAFAVLLVASHWASAKSIKQVSHLFTGLALVITSMGIFMAIVGNLEEDQFTRAVKTLQAALVVLGIMTAIISICAIFAKNPAGFGTFAGITLLFSAMIGVLAWLMITLKDPQDYINLGVAILAIAGLFTVLSILMSNMSKLQPGSWAPVIALFGGLAALALAIAGAAKMLPDEGYVGKIIAVSAVVLGAMLALIGFIWILQKLSKKLNAALDATLLIQLIALTAIFVALAGVIGVLEYFGGTADRLLAVSQVIMLCIFELAAIAVALGILAGKMTLGTFSLVPVLILVGVFAALALVIGVLEYFGGTADRLLAVSQVIILCVFELAAIAAALGILAAEVALGTFSVIPILGLVGVFAALALVIGVLEHFGGTADRMLAVSQVIILCIFELGLISGMLGFLGIAALPALLSVVVLLGLVGIMALIGVILIAVQDLPIEGGLAKFDLLYSLVWKLLDIVKVLALLSVGALGELAGAAAIFIIVEALRRLIEVANMITDANLEAASEGLKLMAQALLLLFEAGAGAAVLGLGLVILAAGVAALGVACLVAAVGVLAFGKAMATTIVLMAEAIESISEKLEEVKTSIQNFLSDAADAIINSPAAQAFINGAKKLAELAASAFTGEWRKGLIWNSPPGVVTNFEKDAADAMVNSPEAKSFVESAKQEATTVVTGLKDKFTEGMSNIVGDALDSGKDIIGNITSGFQSGEGTLLGEFNKVSGWCQTLNSQVQSSLQMGYGTLADFNYQLQDNYAEAKRQVDYYAKKKAEFSKGNLYESKWEEANKNLKEAEDRLYGVGDAADEATESVDDFTTATGGAGSAAKDFAETLAGTLESQMDIFKKFEAKNPMNKAELLANMQSQIKGMTDWAGQMNKLAAMGIDQGLYKKLAEMGPQGAEYVGAFTQMTAEELAQANQLWAQSLTLPGDVAGMIANDFNNIGLNVDKGLAGGIAGAAGEVHDATTKMVQENTTDPAKEVLMVESPSRVFNEIGFNVDMGLALGMQENANIPYNVIEMICKQIVLIAKRELNPMNFKTIGTGVITGIRLGIEEEMDSVTTIMEDLATKLQNAIKSKKALDERSPSHKFEQIGIYISQGLANGINKGSGSAINAVENLSDEAINSMKYTIASISAAINNEMEDPVIRPVLDLSNVQAGVRTLNGIFSTNQALRANASLSNLQNGQSLSGSNVVFNQYNTSPKALSRYDIYRDTRNMLSQYKSAMS